MKDPSVEKLSSLGASQTALMWKCYHCTNLLSSKDQNWRLCIIFKRLDFFSVILAGHLSNSNFFYKVGLSIKSPFFPGVRKRPALSSAAGVAQEPKTDARKCFRLKKKNSLKWEREFSAQNLIDLWRESAQKTVGSLTAGGTRKYWIFLGKRWFLCIGAKQQREKSLIRQNGGNSNSAFVSTAQKWDSHNPLWFHICVTYK